MEEEIVKEQNELPYRRKIFSPFALPILSIYIQDQTSTFNRFIVACKGDLYDNKKLQVEQKSIFLPFVWSQRSRPLFITCPVLSS